MGEVTAFRANREAEIAVWLSCVLKGFYNAANVDKEENEMEEDRRGGQQEIGDNHQGGR